MRSDVMAGMCSVGNVLFGIEYCMPGSPGHHPIVKLSWHPQELGVAFGSSDKREAELLKEEQAKAQTALKARAGACALSSCLMTACCYPKQA